MKGGFMNFKQKVTLLASIGFGLGLITGVTITSVITTAGAADGNFYVASRDLIEAVGNPLVAFLIQAFVSGLYGAVVMGASAVYGKEEWGVTRCTLIHYFIMMIAYCVTAFSLRWYTIDDMIPLTVMLGAMTVVYFCIWLGFFISYRAQLKKINLELLQLKTSQTGV